MPSEALHNDVQPVFELAQDLKESSVLWNTEEFPFSVHLADGHPRVLFVAGDNCTGKSFFVECLRSWMKNFYSQPTTIQVSIRERTGAGTHDMAGMRRTMMFGDESQHSTGATSVKTTERAFDNLGSRHDQGYQTLLVLDEPDLGLSEAYAGGLGVYVGEQALTMPQRTAGLVVVSHSRSFAQGLHSALGCPPTFAHMDYAQSFEQWLAPPAFKSKEEMLALRDLDRAHWKLVSDALRD